MSGVVKQEEETNPNVKPIHINVKVKNQDNVEVFFKIKRTSEMETLMRIYCEKMSLQLKTVAFFIDGRNIKPHNTPEQLEMEDGDEIDVFLHQLGGGVGI
ncbi:hypothetical protein TIFTF001_020821 [Ficus carica]|uniref:Small ubiquitin-related modifier n=1 Tax=Ficus carica TaxID=3494 RepID=A0AA88AS02_FICCA|nr:hypothetical protein TIFTF001_020821 [Ficus carica]